MDPPDGSGLAPDGGVRSDSPVSTTDRALPPKKDAWVPPKKDAWVPPKKDAWVPPKKDAWVRPRRTPTSPKQDAGPPPTAYKVAAIQYSEGQASLVSASCTTAAKPDLCAVQVMVGQAQGQGAAFVVTPEYGLGQTVYEATPVVGENPGTSSAWPAAR